MSAPPSHIPLAAVMEGPDVWPETAAAVVAGPHGARWTLDPGSRTLLFCHTQPWEGTQTPHWILHTLPLILACTPLPPAQGVPAFHSHLKGAHSIPQSLHVLSVPQRVHPPDFHKAGSLPSAQLWPQRYFPHHLV